MKLFETSIMEIICLPLYWLGIDSNVNNTTVFSHVFTPVIVAPFLSLLPGVWAWIGFAGIASFHLVAKELVYDRIKNGSYDRANIWERIYGLILAAGVLAIL